jgi:hypothetical protein
MAQYVMIETFFQKTGKYHKNRPKNGPEMGRKGQNSASSIAYFCTYSFILLNINNINKIKIDSNSFCKLTANTLLKCMQYQARYHYTYIWNKKDQPPAKALPNPYQIPTKSHRDGTW